MRTRTEEISIEINRNEARKIRTQINKICIKAGITLCMVEGYEELLKLDRLLGGNFDSSHEGVHKITSG